MHYDPLAIFLDQIRARFDVLLDFSRIKLGPLSSRYSQLLLKPYSHLSIGLILPYRPLYTKQHTRSVGAAKTSGRPLRHCNSQYKTHSRLPRARLSLEIFKPTSTPQLALQIHHVPKEYCNPSATLFVSCNNRGTNFPKKS